MVDLTLEQANAKLTSVESKADLINIFQKVSVESRGSVDGAKTVLYSRYDIPMDLINDNSIRLIDKTDAAKFLNTNYVDFKFALTRVFGKDNPYFSFKNNIKDHNSALYKFLFGADEGSAWNIISKRFVEQTKGEIVTLIDEGAQTKRVFFKTELGSSEDRIPNYNNYLKNM